MTTTPITGEQKEQAPIVKRKKKTVQKEVPRGCAYIRASYNNTFVTLTDPDGNVLVWSTAGKMGFRGPKKSTPFAAAMVTKDAVERAQAIGLREVTVFVRGIGPGRESAIRSLAANGLNVLSIKDVTPVPHNGCRPKGRRRV